MKNYDALLKDLAPRAFSKRGVIWVSFLSLLIIAGIIAYIDQVRQGQIVTNMRDSEVPPLSTKAIACCSIAGRMVVSGPRTSAW